MIQIKSLSSNNLWRSQAISASVFAVTLAFLQGCTLGSDPIRYESDTKSVVEFMAFDMPLPDSAELDLGGTVIAGTGQNWSGRIAIVDDQTRGELLKFFVERGVETGWELRSTTVSDRMTVVMEKSGRVATIEIGGGSALDRGGLFGGGTAEGRTPVSITVNHENAVENQRPFGTVPGMLLELLPSLPTPAPTPTPPTSSSANPAASGPQASVPQASAF
ncbi:MAG: hypothetical protein EBR00_11110 [Gammaproteobacteria bacterium]|nr:hypothetical protein [Gammaproteobacteria bacterium]